MSDVFNAIKSSMLFLFSFFTQEEYKYNITELHNWPRNGKYHLVSVCSSTIYKSSVTKKYDFSSAEECEAYLEHLYSISKGSTLKYDVTVFKRDSLGRLIVTKRSKRVVLSIPE